MLIEHYTMPVLSLNTNEAFEPRSYLQESEDRAAISRTSLSGRTVGGDCNYFEAPSHAAADQEYSPRSTRLTRESLDILEENHAFSSAGLLGTHYEITKQQTQVQQCGVDNQTPETPFTVTRLPSQRASLAYSGTRSGRPTRTASNSSRQTLEMTQPLLDMSPSPPSYSSWRRGFGHGVKIPPGVPLINMARNPIPEMYAMPHRLSMSSKSSSTYPRASGSVKDTSRGNSLMRRPTAKADAVVEGRRSKSSFEHTLRRHSSTSESAKMCRMPRGDGFQQQQSELSSVVEDSVAFDDENVPLLDVISRSGRRFSTLRPREYVGRRGTLKYV
ncbi:uncharacterized protein F5Z01DRAFT_655415 [Emericellopsis atlantica]|uniref:Uncharacterized protein n=1 Tax=Emericellopsis atlantica TaxID=2614577 RepID=A0A9P7ZLT7_9HYPO|nr:uncharacterized protein F5Z01DRAFT_655415 [Emericellopsis atlantica]KAG9254483.1 hypothetical protein F5Z01DRAFT_655415 [Emericellopsis atlantica]